MWVVVCIAFFIWSWVILEKSDINSKLKKIDISESPTWEINTVTANTDLSKVTRFEVIDHSLPYTEAGRVYTKRDIEKLEFSVQDEGRTLKVFISKNNEHI